MKRLLCVGIWLVAACTSEDGGDDIGETCDPAVSTSCGGETICIGQECVQAFGRNYVFTVRSGTFPQFDRSGDPWDAAGGLPDGFVVLTINGTPFTTRAVQDTLTPAWNQATSPTPIPGGTVLLIEVYDEDLTDDDPAWACQANPLTADFLRGGAITCQGSALPGSNIIVDVRPN